MKIPRLLLSSTGSNSGKTLLTCALLAILKEENRTLAAFKCGPDYIDPMFHEEVLGIPSANLDTFFTGEAQTRTLLAESVRNPAWVSAADCHGTGEEKSADLAVIEGAMGLYDGLGGVRKEGSAYHLAEVTDTPVILIVDAHGMARSLLPLIKGFLDYDKKHLIRGVILNRISGSFSEVIKPEIETYCGIPVLGCLPVIPDIRLESRHLGLIMPKELEDLQGQIKKAAQELKKNLDLPCLLSIAEDAGELHTEPFLIKKAGEKIKIAVAKDEAFCFYYKENLRLLKAAGAELIPFSPLHGEELPEEICGILLGGGYPELHARELSKNSKMRKAVAAAAQKGMPISAECGGFLYLHETLVDKGNKEYPMAGIIPGACFFTGKLVRFGYVEIQEKQAQALPEGETVKGHEFHYYDSSANGGGCLAVKPVSGRSWDCIHIKNTAWMGFPHLYYYSNPEYAYSFLRKAAAYGQETYTHGN